MVAIAYGLPPPLASLCNAPFPFVVAFRPMLAVLVLLLGVLLPVAVPALLPPSFGH